MILALAAGTVLAVGAMAFVLYPLFFGTRSRRRSAAADALVATEPDLAIVALREIEFDRATGKLSETDYQELRRRYMAPALRALDQAAEPSTVAATDPIEDAVRAYRATHRECTACGVRPERDAIYCSECGLYLDGRCRGCGKAVAIAGATFCPDCGNRLAA